MPVTRALSTLVLLSVFALSGCFARYINIDDQEGRAVALGPVFEESPGVYSLTLTVSDYEGDPVNAELSWRVSGGEWSVLERCPSTAPCLQSGLSQLSTKPRGESAAHFARVASEGTDFTQVELRLVVDEDEAQAVYWPIAAP